MKRNAYIFPIAAVLCLALVSFASAGEIAKPGSIETEFNGIFLSSGIVISAEVGDTVPVRVVFDSAVNASDVRVKVRMEGHREEISASTSRFDVMEGVTYSKLLALDLPSDEKDLSKEFTLYVEISSSKDRSEATYTLRLQRESFSLEILAVDYPTQVEAGSLLPVSVVLKNRGLNRADDNFIVASIPALGITSRTYAGDLVPVETPDLENEEDSAYARVFLRIPELTKSGVYEMDIIAYNDDSKTKVTKKVAIEATSKGEKTDLGKQIEGKTTGKAIEDKTTEEDSSSIVALTVVLVIIFVVLLAVLVVLLTKKEKPAADEIETSYY